MKVQWQVTDYLIQSAYQDTLIKKTLYVSSGAKSGAKAELQLANANWKGVAPLSRLRGERRATESN